MTVELTDDQKISVLRQHLSGLLYSQYNIQISIQEASIVKNPDQANLENLNINLQDVNAQIDLLNTKLAELTAPTA